MSSAIIVIFSITVITITITKIVSVRLSFPIRAPDAVDPE